MLCVYAGAGGAGVSVHLGSRSHTLLLRVKSTGNVSVAPRLTQTRLRNFDKELVVQVVPSRSSHLCIEDGLGSSEYVVTEITSLN